MTADELLQFRQALADRNSLSLSWLGGLAPAANDAESTDLLADVLAEAIFLRAFTAYESSLEALFFHYVTGGRSIGGKKSNSYLIPGNDHIARKMVKGGFRFMNWAKPDTIRETARTYMENGWPLTDMMSAKSQELADCERVRNRIAHNSAESATQFNLVQRNLFGTERLFPLSPGQLLRVRHRNLAILQLERFLQVMNETLEAILDPS